MPSSPSGSAVAASAPTGMSLCAMARPEQHQPYGKERRSAPNGTSAALETSSMVDARERVVMRRDAATTLRRCIDGPRQRRTVSAGGKSTIVRRARGIRAQAASLPARLSRLDVGRRLHAQEAGPERVEGERVREGGRELKRGSEERGRRNPSLQAVANGDTDGRAGSLDCGAHARVCQFGLAAHQSLATMLQSAGKRKRLRTSAGAAAAASAELEGQPPGKTRQRDGGCQVSRAVLREGLYMSLIALRYCV